MKKTSTGLLTNLSNNQLENLTREVKETIAFETNASINKTFTTADLWNIQRQSRSRGQRRFF